MTLLGSVAGQLLVTHPLPPPLSLPPPLLESFPAWCSTPPAVLYVHTTRLFTPVIVVHCMLPLCVCSADMYGNDCGRRRMCQHGFQHHNPRQ